MSEEGKNYHTSTLAQIFAQGYNSMKLCIILYDIISYSIIEYDYINIII